MQGHPVIQDVCPLCTHTTHVGHLWHGHQCPGAIALDVRTAAPRGLPVGKAATMGGVFSIWILTLDCKDIRDITKCHCQTNLGKPLRYVGCYKFGLLIVLSINSRNGTISGGMVSRSSLRALAANLP